MTTTTLEDVEVGARVVIVDHERAEGWQAYELFGAGDTGTVLQLDPGDDTLHVSWDRDCDAGNEWWIPVDAVALEDPPPDLTDRDALERWLDD